jgi:hypothetical protein
MKIHENRNKGKTNVKDTVKLMNIMIGRRVGFSAHSSKFHTIYYLKHYMTYYK